ncbi:hypothetical protein GJAV_G00253670 [Gymnothorax javanicus]|nr:hypothetical protein GJAV_G00253670 [Gymnothorax javanicus]
MNFSNTHSYVQEKVLALTEGVGSWLQEMLLSLEGPRTAVIGRRVLEESEMMRAQPMQMLRKQQFHRIMQLILFGITVALQLKGVQSQGIQVKTFETGVNMSLQCSNATLDTLLMESLEMKTRDGGECILSWKYENNTTKSTCNSRITIQHADGVIFHVSPFKSSDEGNYTCETISREGTKTVHFKVKAESNVNASVVQHPGLTPHKPVLWSVFGFTALLTLIVLLPLIVRRKLKRKGRKTPSKTERLAFHAEEMQDIEPYITYIEKTNMIYSCG